MCGSTKYPYPPHGWFLEILRGGGSHTPKFCIGKYAAKVEFPEGRGGSNEKTIRGGGMDIFWNNRMEF